MVWLMKKRSTLPRVISFFTPEWEYPEHAKRLAKECDGLGISHSIQERASTNDYKKNTRIKPFYIREQLRKTKKSVLWLDVDSSLFQAPSELLAITDFDMAAVRMRADNKLQRQWQVGVLCINYNNTVLGILDRWCDAATSGTDEGAFEYAFKNMPQPLRVMELDRERWYQTIKHDGQIIPGAVCGMRIAKSDLKYQTKIRDRAKGGNKAHTTESIQWRMQETQDTRFGDMIACGDTRIVYHDLDNPNMIIKHLFHLRNQHNANLTEWQVWSRIKDQPYSRYFAPCYDISECGNYLRMAMAPRNSREFRRMANSLGSTGDRLDVEALKHIPQELRDDIDRMHQWGVMSDRMVIIDYGSAGFLAGLRALEAKSS
jgi:hypothetical protein